MRLLALLGTAPAAAQDSGLFPDTVYSSTQTDYQNPDFAAPEFGASQQPIPAPQAASTENTQLSPPWYLAAVQFSGNAHVSSGKLQAAIKAASGIVYSRADLDGDIQNITDLGYFTSVTADLTPTTSQVPPNFLGQVGTQSQIIVTFHVVEKPIVTKIVFDGNKSISSSSLRSAAKLNSQTPPIQTGEPLNTMAIGKVEQSLVEAYRKKGFMDVSVTNQVQTDPVTHSATVTFAISEGTSSMVSKVSVSGTGAYSESKILGLMSTKAGKPFSKEKFQQDIQKIAQFYLDRGYIGFQMAQPQVTSNPQGTEIQILLYLDPGKKYYFGHTSFVGNRIISDSALSAVLPYQPGDLFRKSIFEGAIQGIQSLYADKGHPTSSAAPELKPNANTGLVDVRFHIDEGPLMYVGSITITGNKSTKTYALKREILVHPGDVFNAALVRKSKQALLNLGYIDNVKVETKPSATSPGMVNLVFDVTEGKPGSISAGAAYSTLQGLYGTFSVTDKNFLGRAQNLSAQFSYGARVLNYSLSWSDRFIGSWPATLSLVAYDNLNISPFQTSYYAYTQLNRGGSIGITPRFLNNEYSTGFSYSFSKISLYNIQSAYASLLTPGTSTYSSITLSFQRDTRDSTLFPTSGSVNRVDLTFSGGPLGGDINYFEPSLTDSYHHKLFELDTDPFVLDIINQFAFMTPYGSTTQIPVYKRFFFGTINAMRGYSVDEVGDPNGGTAEELYTTQISFPIAKSGERPIAAGHLFYDLGGNWAQLNQMDLRVGRLQTEMKMDAGFGVQFTTPAFPIKIDWGVGFEHNPGEKIYQINFGMGNMF